jgi:hypothetical protein
MYCWFLAWCLYTLRGASCLTGSCIQPKLLYHHQRNDAVMLLYYFFCLMDSWMSLQAHVTNVGGLKLLLIFGTYQGIHLILLPAPFISFLQTKDLCSLNFIILCTGSHSSSCT